MGKFTGEATQLLVPLQLVSNGCTRRFVIQRPNLHCSAILLQKLSYSQYLVYQTYSDESPILLSTQLLISTNKCRVLQVTAELRDT